MTLYLLALTYVSLIGLWRVPPSAICFWKSSVTLHLLALTYMSLINQIHRKLRHQATVW